VYICKKSKISTNVEQMRRNGKLRVKMMMVKFISLESLKEILHFLGNLYSYSRNLCFREGIMANIFQIFSVIETIKN
jgi:hypothetical protein